MMRTLVLLLAAVLLLALPVAAQDGCTEAAPCEWVADVDADGFQADSLEGPTFNGTQGDWMVFSLFNLDDAPHGVRFDAYDLSWEVPPFEDTRTEPFLLDRAGAFQLVDEPSGDTAQVTVTVNDAAAVEAGEEPPITDADATPTTTASKGTPPVALAWAVLALLAVAARRR